MAMWPGDGALSGWWIPARLIPKEVFSRVCGIASAVPLLPDLERGDSDRFFRGAELRTDAQAVSATLSWTVTALCVGLVQKLWGTR